MVEKRAIRCLKCRSLCVEVGRDLSYPKSIDDPEALRRGTADYEHRYVCPGCGAEYVYETLNGAVSEVPEGADFRIRLVDGEEVIQVNSPQVLKFWGLPAAEVGIELRAPEVRKLQERAMRIWKSLSSHQLDDEVFVWERFRLTSEEIRDLLGREI